MDNRQKEDKETKYDKEKTWTKPFFLCGESNFWESFLPQKAQEPGGKSFLRKQKAPTFFGLIFLPTNLLVE